MTDTLQPIREIIFKSKRNIEIEILNLQTKLKEFGFNGVTIDIEKHYIRNEADVRMQESFKVTIKPLL